MNDASVVCKMHFQYQQRILTFFTKLAVLDILHKMYLVQVTQTISETSASHSYIIEVAKLQQPEFDCI